MKRTKDEGAKIQSKSLLNCLVSRSDSMNLAVGFNPLSLPKSLHKLSPRTRAAAYSLGVKRGANPRKASNVMSKPAEWATDIDKRLPTLLVGFRPCSQGSARNALHPGLYSVARLRGLKTKSHVS